MKKRILSAALSVCLLLGLAIVPASAAESEAVQTVQALGIMVGDENGNMALERNVTRAEFAKMLTAASGYKDAISEEGGGYSLFKDVKSGHWASEYIKTALDAGWMTGYTDGTFRPDNAITLEEACAAALRLLGYDPSALAGPFPAAQLSKAASLGLRDGLSRARGERMTRGDCATLFHNLMTAQTSSGQVYASTLGYTLNSAGELDYTALVAKDLKGPYTAGAGGQMDLPFDAAGASVYLDGASSTAEKVKQYDIYYYNAGLKVVYVYTDRVTGTYTAASPSPAAPASATVAGNVYSLGSSNAKYKLSTLGGCSTGDVVTLLLGMDGTAVDVLTGSGVEAEYYGVVQSAEKAVDPVTGSAVNTQLTVACTDGNQYTFQLAASGSFSVGNLVAVSISGGEVAAKRLGKKALSGSVNKAGTKLGDYDLADEIQIMDVSETGAYAAIDVGRLAGCTLNASHVRYYILDENGCISRLILNDATGDAWEYGYMISASTNESDEGVNISGSYRYVIDGRETARNTNNKAYSIQTGGFAVQYETDGSSIKALKNLDSVKLTGLAAYTAKAGNKKYAVAEDVQVYLKQDNRYYLTDLSSVNASDYRLTGYYDGFGAPAGGQIRVIVAVEAEG